MNLQAIKTNAPVPAFNRQPVPRATDAAPTTGPKPLIRKDGLVVQFKKGAQWVGRNPVKTTIGLGMATGVVLGFVRGKGGIGGRLLSAGGGYLAGAGIGIVTGLSVGAIAKKGENRKMAAITLGGTTVLGAAFGMLKHGKAGLLAGAAKGLLTGVAATSFAMLMTGTRSDED